MANLGKIHAADASPSGAGGCVAPITQEAWLALYDLAEESGEHVRLDWKVEASPSTMHDGRAAPAPLALKLDWVAMFSHRFFQGQAHPSPGAGELDQPPQAHHALGTCGFAHGFGSRSKGRSSSRTVDFLFRKLGFGVLLVCDIVLELGWVPTCAKPADRKLVRIVSETSASTDRSLRVSPSWTCSGNRCRRRPRQRKKMF